MIIMLKKLFNLFFITIIVCLISACQHAPDADSRPTAWLTKQVKVKLPEADIETPFTEQQLLTFHTQGQTHSLLAVIDAQKNQLTVVGLSTLGVKLFYLSYQSHQITVEQALFIQQLPPASQILSDIMLSRWPIAAWQKVLPAGWAIEDKGDYRYLRQQGETIITIHYRPAESGLPRSPIHIDHAIFAYQIDIVPMDTTP